MCVHLNLCVKTSKRTGTIKAFVLAFSQENISGKQSLCYQFFFDYSVLQTPWFGSERRLTGLGKNRNPLILKELKKLLQKLKMIAKCILRNISQQISFQFIGKN